ncbi:suppressor of fused domain protein [Methanimicrococcus sp. OttesenSCG-928-J09]|nr:suppressor of fused domain protein [Methanimicrococcus sp. OttesenSCG-928-J09]
MTENLFDDSYEEEPDYCPKMYSQDEIGILEDHIFDYFGEFDNVFHEIVSPDIHVDIAVIEPTPERNYYTLITMGMGAHRMNVPEELSDLNFDRAELMICLPPDWDVKSSEENRYWPIRWLKIMARLPLNHETWLGWGHTVPTGEPIESTDFECLLVVSPGDFDDNGFECEIPDGSLINFYQLIPLYAEEMAYKLENGTEALLELMTDDALRYVKVDRESVCE